MKIRVYNTMAFKNTSEYEADEIIGIGEDADREELDSIRDKEWTPMLNFKTTDGRYLSVPIQLLISIKG